MRILGGAGADETLENVSSSYFTTASRECRTSGGNKMNVFPRNQPRGPESPSNLANCRRRKIILNITFEAGMSMKTKDHKTQCPKRIRHLGLSFRHFTQMEAYFAGISRLFVAFGGEKNDFGFRRRVPPALCPSWGHRRARPRTRGNVAKVAPVVGKSREERKRRIDASKAAKSDISSIPIRPTHENKKTSKNEGCSQ